MIFSYSVHGGAYGMLIALLNGATMHMLDVKKNGLGDLVGWLKREGITVFSCVPTVFRQLARDMPMDMNFPELRLIFLAGEPMYARDVELYKRHFGRHCIFVNRLGSTETDAIRMYFMDKEIKRSSGKTYVPLDPSLPAARTAFILENAQVNLVITDSKNLAPANEFGQAHYDVMPRRWTSMKWAFTTASSTLEDTRYWHRISYPEPSRPSEWSCP